MAQASELIGAAPLQPDPAAPAVVSQHQTFRLRDPLGPHEGPQLPQPSFFQLKQFEFEHEVDSGVQPPHTDSDAPDPSEYLQEADRYTVCGPQPLQGSQLPHEHEAVHEQAPGEILLPKQPPG
jgi:hypothetical protein